MRPVVIDAGSWTVKAGFGGATAPKTVLSNHGLKNEAELYELIFDELGMDPKDKDVLVTDHLLCDPESREATAKIFFEQLKVKKLFIVYDAVLALYATGRKQGVVVDIGHSHAYVVPVIDGYAVPASVKKLTIDGKSLNNFIAKDLKEKNYNSLTTGKIVKRIKEEMCSVASEKSNTSVTLSKMVQLPDEQQSETIETQWFKYAEALFDPALSGATGLGVDKLVEQCVGEFKPALQKVLWNNIVVQSGTTLLPGFAERLQLQLNLLAPPSMKAKVICGNAMHGTWVGGSILVTLLEAKNLYITAEEYAEKGVSAVHAKCI